MLATPRFPATAGRLRLLAAARQARPWSSGVPPPAAAARLATFAAARPRVAHNRSSPTWLQARAFSGKVHTQAVNDFGAESITEGSLVEFRKKVGDSVTKGEHIASIETDKVTVEINAEESGVIKELLAAPDDTIVKGQNLVSIEVGAAGSAPAASAPAASAPAASAPAAAAPASSSPGRVIEQGIMDFGAESITEGTLMEFRKKVGEAVNKGDIIAVIETDKVSVELNADESGVVRELLAQPDDTVKAGQMLVKIEVGAAGAAAAAPTAGSEAATPAAAAATTQGLTGIRLGFAQAAAKRAGLPVPGEGGAVVSAAASAAPAPAAKPTAVGKSAPAPAPKATGEGKRMERSIPMSFVRAAVAQRLKDSQNTMALLTTFQEADLTNSIALRNKYKDVFKKTHGADLGLLSIIIKACAGGLMDIPGVNGVIDDGANEIVYRDYVDISVPIPSPRGPVSCVVRNAESMSIKQIEKHLAGLMDRAKNDQLSPADMADATFGIVDNGSSGGMLGTSFINPPASATLGTNSITQRAAVVDGKVVARPVMYLSLTYDHRLVDGREAATFLGSVRDKLEDPGRLLLDV